jgi:DNA-binding NarL/FixJ family response regulator
MDEPAILIVDNDAALCKWLETTLVSLGMSATSVLDLRLVTDEIEKNFYNLVLLGGGGLEMSELNILTRLRELCPQTKVIVMTNEADKDAAVAALRMGAFDVLEKAAPLDLFSYTVHRALQTQKMEAEHRQALAELQRMTEESQAYAVRIEALTNELKEANQAVLVLARNIEQAKRDGEAHMMMRVRSLLLPLIRCLRQEREMLRYVAQLDTILQFIEDEVESLATNMPLVTMLSASELRIALMIKDGMTSDEIAARLYLSPETVKSHRKNIRKKLGLRGSRERLRAYFESLDKTTAHRVRTLDL